MVTVDTLLNDLKNAEAKNDIESQFSILSEIINFYYHNTQYYKDLMAGLVSSGKNFDPNLEPDENTKICCFDMLYYLDISLDLATKTGRLDEELKSLMSYCNVYHMLNKLIDEYECRKKVHATLLKIKHINPKEINRLGKLRLTTKLIDNMLIDYS